VQLIAPPMHCLKNECVEERSKLVKGSLPGKACGIGRVCVLCSQMEIILL